MASIHQFPSRPTPKNALTDERFNDPEKLHFNLPVAATVVVTFRNEKAMRRYRWNLYSINKQGTFRYRTIRDEGSMWGIVVWRMH